MCVQTASKDFKAIGCLSLTNVSVHVLRTMCVCVQAASKDFQAIVCCFARQCFSLLIAYNVYVCVCVCAGHTQGLHGGGTPCGG